MLKDLRRGHSLACQQPPHAHAAHAHAANPKQQPVADLRNDLHLHCPTVPPDVCAGVHGWGIFAARDMPQDSMVVEYRGVSMRPVVAEVLEQRYRVQGKDCYFFKVGRGSLGREREEGGASGLERQGPHHHHMENSPAIAIVQCFILAFDKT